jgi:hypothetical protein
MPATRPDRLLRRPRLGRPILDVPEARLRWASVGGTGSLGARTARDGIHEEPAYGGALLYCNTL